MPANFVTKIAFFISITMTTSIPFYSCALDIRVVDENGLPVPNVVVSVPHEKMVATQSAELPVATMDQVDYQYQPQILVVAQNQWVDFPNSDNVRHHVYSFSKAKTFEIKMYAGSDAKPLQFKNPGIVVLGCNIHDSMVGYIYVSDSDITRVTDAQGKAQLPDNITNVELWHPDLSIDHSERAAFAIAPSINQATLALSMPVKASTNMGSNSLPHSLKNKFERLD